MEQAVAAAELPAFALFAEGGELIRSTESFGHWREQVCEPEPRELARLLEGDLDRAEVTLDRANAKLEAVLDAAGRRRVLLTVTPFASTDLDPVLVLADAVASSPALAWLKDLDGRNLLINSVYTEALGTPEERIKGRRDDELSPRETVDGPRSLGGTSTDEPMEFEYTVAPFEGRPALAVLRFAVRDREHQAIATCGVAAPLNNPHLAESECIRLLQLERSCRLEPPAARAEVLSEWELNDDLTAAQHHAEPPPELSAGLNEHLLDPGAGDQLEQPSFAPAGPAVRPEESRPAPADRARELEAELVERDRQLESSRAELAERDRELRLVRAELADREGRLEAALSELADARRQLDAASSEPAAPSASPAPLAADSIPTPPPAAPPPAPPPAAPTPPPPAPAPPPASPPPPPHAARAPTPAPAPPPKRGLLARLAGRGRR